MINTDLKDRLLSIFPEGDTAGVDESVLDDNQHMELLPGIVSEFCAQTHLNARSVQWSKCFCNHWYFTSLSDPDHEEWFWKNISIKNEWVKQHNKPYRMIVVRVSRVAPYFDYHMNHFYGYGAENLLNKMPVLQLCHDDEQWQVYANLLLNKLTKNGFTHASDHFLQQHIPFMTTWGGDLI